MRLRLLIILCTLTLASACSKEFTLNPDAEFCGVSGPKIRVPTLTVRISLSEAAAKKLQDAGETIGGLINFDGDGVPKKNEYTAPNRPILLGCYQFEIKKPGEISIPDALYFR